MLAVVVVVCSLVFLPEDMYGLLKRLVFRPNMDLAKGFVPWFQFSGYTFKLEDVDDNDFSFSLTAPRLASF